MCLHHLTNSKQIQHGSPSTDQACFRVNLSPTTRRNPTCLHGMTEQPDFMCDQTNEGNSVQNPARLPTIGQSARVPYVLGSMPGNQGEGHHCDRTAKFCSDYITWQESLYIVYPTGAVSWAKTFVAWILMCNVFAVAKLVYSRHVQSTERTYRQYYQNWM